MMYANDLISDIGSYLANEEFKIRSIRIRAGIAAAKERRKELALKNTVNDSENTKSQIQP